MNTCSFDDCDKPVRALGLCGGHWQQQRKGKPLSSLKYTGVGQSVADRLERHTDKSGDCWLWVGSLKTGGYGQIYFEGKNYNAHRLAYIVANGPVDADVVIDHMCHVRRCVNPSHLQAVSNKQNVENRGVLNANNTTGARGVVWDKARKKWKAQFRHAGRLHFLGRFDSFGEAESAVIKGRNDAFDNNLVDRGLNVT